MGSEYDIVIIPILSAHCINLSRNMLYTAITRAKSRVFLVGQRGAMNIAIKKKNVENRNTFLAHRILCYYQFLSEKRNVA